MINNRGFSASAAPKLQTHQSVLFDPEGAGKWSYSHHAHITSFQGKLYAMWSSGRLHEDMFGQRVMMSRSENGIDWEKPVALFDTILGERSEGVLTAAGFYEHAGTLRAYAGYYERNIELAIMCGTTGLYEKIKDKLVLPQEGTSHTRTYVISTTDGEHWSPLQDTGLPMVPNLPPQRTASGRLIFPGNYMFPYTDDPAGVTGWVKTGLFPASYAPYMIDNAEYTWTISDKTGYPWACEGSFFQTDDGVIHMLLSTDWVDDDTNFLCVSESADDGRTWSRPERTAFSDDCAKFFCGRLPDRRFFVISNPLTHNRRLTTGRRCPLVISLSDDGENFNKFYAVETEPVEMKYEGLCKGGIYGYPHATIWKDRMYVIYSVNKEKVAVTSFDLKQLV